MSKAKQQNSSNHSVSQARNDKFNCLDVFEKQYWGEYQEKTKLEWKFSFGIWSSLISVIVASVTEKIVIPDSYSLIITTLGVILVIHFWFLVWIMLKLRIYRQNIKAIRDMMSGVASIDVLDHDVSVWKGEGKGLWANICKWMRKWTSWVSITLIIQCLITTLLLLIIFFMSQNISNEPLYYPKYPGYPGMVAP